MNLFRQLWEAIRAFFCSWRVAFGLVAVVCLFQSISSSKADSFQLLSARNPAVLLPAGGNGNSVSPILSPDGRFVLFTSAANDLVPGGNSYFFLNLFLRDRASNTTVLVSANMNGTGGGNGSSINGMVSTNGRWVVFQSDASDLRAGDTNSTTDIFVRDVQTGSNILVSVAMDGGWANGVSQDAAMTPDGRYVAFFSAASNLVPNDTNGIPDVFVRDVANGTTVLASVGAVKASSVGPVISSGPPVITPDGTRVAFFSAATNLVVGVSNSSGGEVYVRDLVAHQTFWASSNALATAHITPGGGERYLSCHPVLSAVGDVVVFKTSATTGLKRAAILKFDLSSNLLTLVATNCLPLMFSDDVYGPEVSADGRFIAFARGNPTNGQVAYSSVYLADTQAGTNILVSVCQDGSVPTNSVSHTPVVSPDGRFVAFMSNATNLVGNVISNGFHIYLRDVFAGTTTLVDTDTTGVGAVDEYGNAPSLTPDGAWMAFASPDGGFVGNDQNHATDVFLRNVTNGVNEMISVRNATVVPVSGSGFSSAAQVSMTPDGQWVVFSSRADDLVTNDFNQDQDVFVKDLASGSLKLESVGLDGNSAAGYSGTPMISSNGQFVVFFSTATNLVPGYSNLLGDIFLRDCVAGTNTLVSVSVDGVSAGRGSSSAPAVSQDGRYVAFLSTATNLVPLGTTSKQNTFWRDTALGVTVALTANVSAVFPPSISADGRFVAFSSGTTVAVWDSQVSTNIYTAPGTVTSAVISPDGGHLLYQGNNAVAVVDLSFKSNVISKFSVASVRSPAQWSADGRFCVFVARSNTASGAFSHNQVYLGDVSARTVALISSTADHSTGGNDISDSPVLSGNGQYVVYRSFAKDISPGALPGSTLILFNRATGSNTVVNPSATNLDWSSAAARAVMDAAGQTVIFQGVQSTLASGDINRLPDLYAGHLEVTLDSDGDGVPDWWMVKYFGHPTGSAGDHSQAGDDADGDGFTNLAEFLTGSDPSDSQSVLRMEISSPDSQNITLTWPAVAGKSYQVQYKTDLNDPSWLDFGSPMVANPAISITIPVSAPTGFYRVIAIN